MKYLATEFNRLVRDYEQRLSNLKELDRLLTVVNDFYGTQIHKLGPKGALEVKEVRAYVLYKMVSILGYSLTEAGKVMNMDRTCVRERVNKVISNPELIRKYNKLFKAV